MLPRTGEPLRGKPSTIGAHSSSELAVSGVSFNLVRFGCGNYSPGSSRQMSKIQRWVDLMAALLRRTGAAPLEELVRDVPGYRGYLSEERTTRESARRSFERDKDELRGFGVPIVTVQGEDGELRGYQIKRENFYLPYLTVLRDGRNTRPRRIDRYGYRALAQLTFEPDELEAVVAAAHRLQRLGDPVMAELAASALRKLAFDLPISVAEAVAFRVADLTPSYAPRIVEQGEVLEAIDDAMRRRKLAIIEYFSMSRGASGTRTVAPYGLFFLGHNWYLAARDGESGPVKNFRVSRIHSITVNQRQPSTPDYEIPADFDLRAHARSRQSWELGDDSAVEAVVEFRGESGPTIAARRLGEPVDGTPSRRRFTVRREDAFARWLLSFGGEALPLSPAELVDRYRELAQETLARYQSRHA
jgi:proteasome accessory factor B